MVDTPEVMRYTRPATLFSGGGGLVSTVSDYLRFSLMLLYGGTLDGAQLLGRDTVGLMTVNHLPKDLLPFNLTPEMTAHTERCGFGLGFKIVEDSETTVYAGPRVRFPGMEPLTPASGSILRRRSWESS